MALRALVSAYNEESLLADAVRSALAAGVDEVHVFDGAWRAVGPKGPAFAGARRAGSTDGTEEVARAAGAIFHPARRFWDDQGIKRTAAFQRCGAKEGDHLLIVDADERVTGRFPPELPRGHLNVLLRSIGENDLPGTRGVFPKGDYRATPGPCLRLFAWEPELRCLQPGEYFAGERRLVPYKSNGTSLLPLIREVCIEHHANLRTAERLEEKRDYYAADHPVRRDRLEDALMGLPWWKGEAVPPGIAPRTAIVENAQGRRVQVVAGSAIPNHLREAYDAVVGREDAKPKEAPKPKAAQKRSASKRRTTRKKA